MCAFGRTQLSHMASDRDTPSTTSVRCLQARAKVADPAPEVRRARAQAVRGDADWRRRLQRYEHGDTLIVALTSWAMIDGEGERAAPLCFSHELVWVDRPVDRDVLAERLRRHAARDFQTVAPRLRDRGIRLAASERELAVQVVLDSDVERSLRPGGDAPS